MEYRSMLARFRRLLSPRRPEPNPPRVPDGAIVYAVGDVHGRADLLSQTLRAIRTDARGSEERTTVVFLGDYVDRGPASRDVIEMLLAARKDSRFKWRFLRGNHDKSVRDFLHDPASGQSWCELGGAETLMSYGVRAPEPGAAREAWITAASALVAAMPPQHLKFFREIETRCEIGDYLFVHAGLRPGVPLEQQTEEDMLWIREPFLSDTRPLPKVVVHGHTPSRNVHADQRRIGIDTGAYLTGVLTALRLEGDMGSVIQTAGPGRRQVSEMRPLRTPSPPPRREPVRERPTAFRPAAGGGAPPL
jgi:serine/threonine protein phosphatase 1